MNYNVMTYAQAEGFSGFILPHVRTMKDREAFLYVCASDDSGLTGMAVIDPHVDRAELLSISVSPQDQRKGIATELLIYACGKLSAAGVPLLFARYALPQESWTVLGGLMEKAGFLPEDAEHPYYNCTLADALNAPLIKRFHSDAPSRRAIPLRELPNTILHDFSAKLVREDQFSSIKRDEFQQDLSWVWLEKDQVMACFLVQQVNPEHLENLLTYLDSKASDPAALVHCIACAAEAGAKLCSPDCTLGFACLTEASDHLLKRILPELTASQTERTYLCATDLFALDPGETPLSETIEAIRRNRSEHADEQELPEAEFTIATDKGLLCESCAFRTDKLTSCVKYSSKPGAVLYYGGTCALYQKA